MADPRPRADRTPRRVASALALALAVAAASLTAAPRARAVDLKSGVGVAVVGFGGVSSLDHELHATTEPDLLASRSPRLEGNGGFAGGALRILAVLDRYRFTFEEGVYGLAGARYRLDGAPLPAGFSSDADKAWGAHFEVSAGRQFDLGPVSPYAELRAGMSFSVASVNLRSTSYGFLGVTSYTKLHLLIAPRIGAIYRLGRETFVDVGASADLTGPERFGVSVALGVWLGAPQYGPSRRGFHW